MQFLSRIAYSPTFYGGKMIIIVAILNQGIKEQIGNFKLLNCFWQIIQ